MPDAELLEAMKDELADEFIEYLKAGDRGNKIVHSYTEWLFEKIASQELRLRKLESKQ